MLKSFFRDGSNVAGMNMFWSLWTRCHRWIPVAQAACYNFLPLCNGIRIVINAYRAAKRGVDEI